ncbi:hypothetical protein [Nocardia cyriacigeorgica]|uniref:hypothetical protein n=1 Tax=Nocardia cyriacigeorgica TaxID=135487 RepID=UPI0018960FDB|nr:hypothetical protein [Nocardia cyriacigeorgica]MBF6439284.1 hypothetical protein [Nocardia cyriacigeorgica]MBF6455543.1 hypothetical protein [Nocardia cyriacigeorgica]MBF6479583.1 hypothetical protein [Nocardia cyriacigeorgica]MBF6553715.1 hypothetical protein [Nocardia cyriacigeorgica]
MNDILRVDWTTFYEAAAQCHQLATDLRAADKPVHDAVKGECAGMAGDAPGCKQWGEKYDQVAVDTMQTCTNLADALTNFGYALYAMGYHYGQEPGRPPAPRPTIHAMSEHKVSIPASTADNGNGIERDDSVGVEEVFDAVLAKVGEEFGKLPNGDTGKLDKASSVWKTFAEHEAVTGAAARIQSIKALFDNTVDPENLPKILAHLDTLHGGATNLAAATSNIASPVAAYHTGTVDVRAAFESALKTALIAITATLAVAAVSAWFTFGASLAAGGATVTVVAGDAALAIGTAYRASKLFQAIGLTAAAAGGAVTAGKVNAFDAVPSLNTVIAGLAGIIAMKVFLDEEDDAGGGETAAEPDFRHGEYTQAEIEEFINGHTGNGDPTMDRPTPAEVHEALTKGRPQPMGDGRAPEQAEQFVHNGIKVVVNYEMPWRSTAWRIK